ncbi:MAG: hypothetical protein RSE41_05175 [Clostridia bacterium]
MDLVVNCGRWNHKFKSISNLDIKEFIHYIEIINKDTFGYKVDLYYKDIDEINSKFAITVKEKENIIIQCMYKNQNGVISEFHLVDLMKHLNWKEYIDNNKK